MFRNNSLNGVDRGPQAQVIYEFGTYSLNVGEHWLTLDGEKLHLKPKAFDLLVFLLERNNQVATKDEIFENVWQGAFVEEANLAVHISALRKVFGSNGDQNVSIETIPKLGYRLKVETGVHRIVEPEPRNLESEIHPQLGRTQFRDAQFSSRNVASESKAASGPNMLVVISIALAAGALMAVGGFMIWQSLGEDDDTSRPQSKANRIDPSSWKRVECPRDSAQTNSVLGGCEDAVYLFNLDANPSGNWSYGYTPKDNWADFRLFDQPGRNNHFASPGLPTDTWTPKGEWHPVILRNTSQTPLVIQEGVLVPPSMVEMHPGPNGERCVFRWTSPLDGSFRIQGQFRGINLNGDTISDFRLVRNGEPLYIYDDVIGFNFGKPFDITLELARGETIDFSVGYGTNEAYENDSTGFSAIITTVALQGNR